MVRSAKAARRAAWHLNRNRAEFKRTLRLRERFSRRLLRNSAVHVPAMCLQRARAVPSIGRTAAQPPRSTYVKAELNTGSTEPQGGLNSGPGVSKMRRFVIDTG